MAASPTDLLASASVYDTVLSDGDDLHSVDTTNYHSPTPENLQQTTTPQSLPAASSPLSQPPPPPPPEPPAASTVVRFCPADHAHMVVYLAALHAACITRDGLAGTFAPPLHHEKLLAWWKQRLAEASSTYLLVRPATGAGAAAGVGASAAATAPTPSPFSSSSSSSSSARALYRALAPAPTSSAAPVATTTTTTSTTSSTTTTPAKLSKLAGADLVGVAMLRNHPAETSPHVAAVTLLVSRRHAQEQQPGGERQLQAALERQALADKRTLLTAEAEADSAAAATFFELGFFEAGRIPGCVVHPGSGQKRAQILFYKDLASPS